MKKSDIAHVRLHNQQLSSHKFSQPADLVRWLGAVQAQDYYGAMWALAMRLKSGVVDDIEAALAARSIARSWPMRGTLHFVAPEDLRWMLKYLAAKVFPRMNSNYRKSGLDKKIFMKSGKIWEKELSGKQMTREELYDVLEKNKIDTSNTRGLFILGYLAQEGLICFGPRRGKQQTLALLDEWLPQSKMPERDEALAALALRYTVSHGPVQVEDFAWWTGLTKKESIDALEANRGKILEETIDGKRYWIAPDLKIPKAKPTTFLIPTYDEMGVGYKDRTAIIDREVEKKIANSIFTSGIMIDGKIVGTWKRTIEKDEVAIEIKPLRKLTAKEKKSVEAEAKKYSKFIGKKLSV